MVSKDDVSIRELSCGAGNRRARFCDASLSIQEEGAHGDQVPQAIVVDRAATLLGLPVRARVSVAKVRETMSWNRRSPRKPSAPAHLGAHVPACSSLGAFGDVAKPPSETNRRRSEEVGVRNWESLPAAEVNA